MQNNNDILEHVKSELTAVAGVDDISFEHLFDRFFSIIYEVKARKAGSPCAYILKISTTSRSCQNEFDQYNYLSKVGVLSLVPVLFSEKHNYLVTEKEELTQFDKFVKKQTSKKNKMQCFYSLGAFFRDMSQKTGGYSVFDKAEFDEYVMPRLAALKVFSESEKSSFANKISATTSKLSNKKIRTCFISDFSLGNINFDKDHNILILDMGDAYFGNCYENLSYLQLSTLFGPLSQYVALGNSHERYFSEFLRGYAFEDIDQQQFTLYRIKHLIEMIDFISSYEASSNSVLRRVASNASNRYLIARYKRYTRKIIRGLI